MTPTPPYLVAQRRLDDHYNLFYFDHGKPPAVIYAPMDVILDAERDPALAFYAPANFKGVERMCRGSALRPHNLLRSTIVWSPLPR